MTFRNSPELVVELEFTLFCLTLNPSSLAPRLSPSHSVYPTGGYAETARVKHCSTVFNSEQHGWQFNFLISAVISMFNSCLCCCMK